MYLIIVASRRRTEKLKTNDTNNKTPVKRKNERNHTTTKEKVKKKHKAHKTNTNKHTHKSPCIFGFIAQQKPFSCACCVLFPLSASVSRTLMSVCLYFKNRAGWYIHTYYCINTSKTWHRFWRDSSSIVPPQLLTLDVQRMPSQCMHVSCLGNIPAQLAVSGPREGTTTPPPSLINSSATGQVISYSTTNSSQLSSVVKQHNRTTSNRATYCKWQY